MLPNPPADQVPEVNGDDENPREKLAAEIRKDISGRVDWEKRQVDFYRMRHNGIARAKKPWNNAADLHWPLIDTNIEKLKPLFFQQLFGMDIVATFVPMQQQTAPITTSAANWFDYKMRERTNLQDEALGWIDYTLMSGRAPIKVTWNSTKSQVEFTAIDPMYFVVPPYTRYLQDADRICHIMPMSVGAYKRSGRYDTSEDTIDKIKGRGDDSGQPGITDQRQTRQTREGLTHDSSSDKIIVWEVYEKQDNNTWIVSTFSPVAPELDLRPRMMLPYDHGMAPFVDFPYEIKDTGWYSPRGVAEILAAFEAAICHTWNQKHDSMQLFNKPVFTTDRELPNSMNLRLSPGQILPQGVAPAPAPQPPISFDAEMDKMQTVAEQRVGNPDFSNGGDDANARTATEVQASVAQSGQAGDLRARIFRIALGKMYKMAWSLLVQFDSQDLLYRFQDDALNVDPAALHDKYHIEPKGGVNEVNKTQLLQMAQARKQLFANSPWINQPELDKSILELDDPSLIKRLFQDPNQKAADEAADENQIIPTLLLGNQVPAGPGLNYQARLGAEMQFLQKAVTTGFPPMNPQGTAAIVGRIESLLQGFGQVNNNGAKQLGNMIQQFLKQHNLLPQGTNGQLVPQGGNAPAPQQQSAPPRPPMPMQRPPVAGQPPGSAPMPKPPGAVPIGPNVAAPKPPQQQTAMQQRMIQ